jgi:hypothetical protein
MPVAPIRVYLRGKIFYLQYYAGRKVMISTGIEADIDEPERIVEDPDWWRKSIHAEELAQLVNAAEDIRTGHKKKARKEKLKERRQHIAIFLHQDDERPDLPHLPRSLEEIADLYHTSIEAINGPLKPGIKERRTNALKLLRRYDRSYTYQKITDEWLKGFREFVKTANNGRSFADSTMNGYVTDYRTIVTYGLKHGYLDDDKGRRPPNKFEKMIFQSTVVPSRKTPWEDEQEVFTFLYTENKPLFDQIILERLTGFRVTWTCELLLSEINRRRKIITSLNTKSDRVEDFPIIEPLEWVLNQLDQEWALEGKTWKLKVLQKDRFNPYLFKYRSRSTVYRYLHVACKEVGVAGFGPHKLKKNYISEWRRYTGDPDVINFLSHHSISGATSTSRKHYVDPEEIMEVARETLERAQPEKWMKFFASLKKVKPSGKTYSWSDKSGHWSARHPKRYGNPDYVRGSSGTTSSETE